MTLSATTHKDILVCTLPQQAGRQAQHNGVGAEDGVVSKVRGCGDCDIAQSQASLAQRCGHASHPYITCVQCFQFLFGNGVLLSFGDQGKVHAIRDMQPRNNAALT